MPATEQKIRETVRQEAEDGRLACARALAIARRLGVDTQRVGDACNAEGVKIVDCQLGCFP